MRVDELKYLAPWCGAAVHTPKAAGPSPPYYNAASSIVESTILMSRQPVITCHFLAMNPFFQLHMSKTLSLRQCGTDDFNIT